MPIVEEFRLILEFMLESIFSYKAVSLKYSTLWPSFSCKSIQKGFLFVLFLHTTDPQSLSKIQKAPKTKKFLSLKQTFDGTHWTNMRLFVVLTLCGVNELHCSKINMFYYGVLFHTALEVYKLCGMWSILSF